MGRGWRWGRAVVLGQLVGRLGALGLRCRGVVVSARGYDAPLCRPAREKMLAVCWPDGGSRGEGRGGCVCALLVQVIADGCPI